MVFCSGNGDRSPLAEQVLKTEFAKKGLKNVKISSFGVSVTPAKHLTGAAARTSQYASELGFEGINAHRRRSISDPDVLREIKESDLLLAVSDAHSAFVAEYGADENPQAARTILSKTWTLKGLANGTQWTAPFGGAARVFNQLYRGLASKDPYFQPETVQGNKKFRLMLDDLIKTSKKAAGRLSK